MSVQCKVTDTPETVTASESRLYIPLLSPAFSRFSLYHVFHLAEPHFLSHYNLHFNDVNEFSWVGGAYINKAPEINESLAKLCMKHEV